VIDVNCRNYLASLLLQELFTTWDHEDPALKSKVRISFSVMPIHQLYLNIIVMPSISYLIDIKIKHNAFQVSKKRWIFVLDYCILYIKIKHRTSNLLTNSIWFGYPSSL